MTIKFKASSLLVFILLFLQCLFLYAFPTTSNNAKLSTSEFFKQFQGLNKGEKAKGIHELKNYLKILGYFEESSHIHDDLNDHFDDKLHFAIRTYQINFNLNPTGIMDPETISTMARPRCGVPDIINGSTRMKYGSNNFHLDYKFFDPFFVWPSNKLTLTYAFKPKTRADFQEPISKSLEKWISLTPFSIKLIEDYEKADIKIAFEKLDHGDGKPFDGPFNTVAHSFAPPDGRLHFDAEERWVIGAIQDSFDIGSIALHELGHIMGLDHSSVENAIMHPIVPKGSIKGLDADDIEGIRTLYGKWN